MRMLLVVAVFALAVLSYPALAEVRMPGQPCNDLGVTTMADDHANLVACMLIAPGAAATCASGGGCTWKAMTNGGACFTYYCGGKSNVATYTPNSCADNGGARKHCPAGFRETADLGMWGACIYVNYAPNHYLGVFMPPGGGCVINHWVTPAGNAYLCCQ